MEEKKEMKERVGAVVLAAGKGRRMGTETAKQFLELKGKPLIYYELKAFEDSRSGPWWKAEKKGLIRSMKD